MIDTTIYLRFVIYIIVCCSENKNDTDKPYRSSVVAVGATSHDRQQRKRIMVVDDEDEVNVILRLVLEEQFLVDVFNDPIAALDNFKPGLYDLLLLDIRMPKNGWTCTL